MNLSIARVRYSHPLARLGVVCFFQYFEFYFIFWYFSPTLNKKLSFARFFLIVNAYRDCKSKVWRVRTINISQDMLLILQEFFYFYFYNSAQRRTKELITRFEPHTWEGRDLQVTCLYQQGNPWEVSFSSLVNFFYHLIKIYIFFNFFLWE